MTRAIVIFASTTGNTEALVESVALALKENGVEVTTKNVANATIDELSNYHLVLLASSTWDGLSEDFEDFHQKLAGLSLVGKKAAVFGPGDSANFPDAFCESVDVLEERLKQCGAEIVTRALKIDRPMGEEMDDAAKEEAKAWALNIAHSL